MSLTEQAITAVQGENGTEYTLITTPVTVGEGEVIHQAVIQHVGSAEQQENIDPQTHILMLQPITVTGPDGVEHIQHVLQDQTQVVLQGTDLQQLQDGQILTEHILQEQPIITHQVAPPQTAPQPAPPPAPPHQAPIQPPVGKGPFRCALCDKEFPKWNQLQRHMRSHEEDKPFRCPHCPQTFNVEYNLRLHVATHNTDSPLCPECGKKFSRIASLKAHIMHHEKEESLMCTECGDEFSLQVQLDRHMLEHQEEQQGTKTYPCKQCTLEFPRLSQLREHMKQHYKIKHSLSHRTYKRNVDRTGFSHRCDHCNKTFQKPSQLERHIRIHTGERPFKCVICDKAFNQKGALQIHMTKHTGDKPFVCDFCKSTFSQKGNLRAHIQRVHSHPRDSDAPVFQCDECSCVFRKLGSLNAHMSRVHSFTEPVQQIILPDDPGDIKQNADDSTGTEGEEQTGGATQGSAPTVTVLEPSKNVNDVIQQLLELSEQVTDSEATQQHLQQMTVNVNISSDILQQALENSGLTTVQQSGAGTSTTATITNGNLRRITAPGVTSTMMVHDSATGDMKKHIIRKVNGVRWHQCTYCTKEFKKPSDLVRHIRIHTHEKPYKCTQCFRAFAVKSTLTAHVKTHTGIKEFKCLVCQKMFSTQGSLKVHMRLHTGTKPFDCPHCEKRFRTSGHRKTHIQSHYKESSPRKPRRPNKRPDKPDSMQLPDIPLQEPILITDTGLIQQQPRNSQVFSQYLGEAGSVDRPYKCGYCTRGFKKSSHLKQHIRSHTGEKPYKCLQCMRSFVSSGVLKAHIRTHTGLKSFKCLICDSTFTTNGSLKRHMSTHSDVRPFMCPYCQKTFKTSMNCKKHMKTHKHELAIQALHNSQDPDKHGHVPTEVALTQEVEAGGASDDDDDDDDGAEPIEIHTTQVEVQESDLTQTLQQVSTEPQTQTITLSQQDYGGQTLVQQDLTSQIPQQTVIQDALVTDPQLQNTLNQQVFGSQPIQQNFTQSLLTSNPQTFNQFNQNSFTIQTQSVQNGLDVSGLPAYSSQGPTSMATTLTSTNMSNILPTRDDDMEEDDVDDGDPDLQGDTCDDGTRTYRCGYCDKAFKKSSHLKQHVRSHTGEKPYKCLQCGRMFVSGGVLKAHLKTHTGQKDYRCQICQASFTTNGSLTRHMMIHSSIRPYKCPYCPDTFRTIFHCKRHIKNHKEQGTDTETDKGVKKSRSAIIQITEEQAEELSKATPDENMSVSEKILIESASEKDRVSEVKTKPTEQETQELPEKRKHPHACPHCPKSFKKPSDLLRHIRIHTGEKPFSCDVCARTFTVKSTLDSHVKTHQATDKRYKCHVCHSGFSTKGSLKVHMRLHTGAKPFKCPHCDHRFRTSGHRKSHVAAHFKPIGLPKKKRGPARSIGIDSIQILNEEQAQNLLISANQSNQIINIDQAGNIIQGQTPLSLAFQDALGGLVEGNQATQVLQGLDGIQLQFSGASNIGGQGIQITGLDPNVLTQTVQIDASLLQQLQQQGNLNLAINPNVLQNQTLQQPTAVDPNLVQNIQIQQGAEAAVNPNILIHPQAMVVQNENGQMMTADGQVIGTAVDVTEVGQDGQHAITIQPGQVAVSQPQVVVTQPQMVSAQPQMVSTQPQMVSQTQFTAPQTEAVTAQPQLNQQQVVVSQPQVIMATAVPESEQEMEVNIDVVDDDDNIEDNEEIAPEGVSEENIEHLHTEGAITEMVQEAEGQDKNQSQDQQIQVTLNQNGEVVMSQATLSQATALASSLQGHQIIIHPSAIQVNPNDPERSHICHVCNKAFKRAGHLKEHLLTHVPGPSPGKQRVAQHKCNQCEKAFNKPSQLERHIRIHTGERPFQCDICKKAFNQKNALQIHVKKHSGDRPYQCPYCPNAFTQKGNLKTHIKRAHHLEMVQSMNIPKSLVETATSTATISEVEPSSGDKEVEVPGASQEETINLDWL